MKIALISCSKSKMNYACMAKEMYSASTLFQYSYEYAKKVADKIYILSAKYGLIKDSEYITPYDITLKNMETREKEDWYHRVRKQLQENFDLASDHFIILAGRDYYGGILFMLPKHELPLGTMALGERISWLQNTLYGKVINTSTQSVNYSTIPNSSNYCRALHKIFNQAPRYSYKQINDIPFDNGIYIIFERNERYGEYDRIVRVGTHNVQNRLKPRLRNHFIQKNKDGSIFRKNIGKAILNYRHDSYLNTWNIDTSRPENKKYINNEKQSAIEDVVSQYLQNNMTFTVFRVDDDNLRLRLEKGIIASLNADSDFYPSINWLGNYSTEDEIRKSGLWLKIGLENDALTEKEFKFIVNTLSEPTGQYKQQKLVFHETQSSISSYINQILQESRRRGEKTCVLVSGNIHKGMGLSNKMPSVCNAMYKAMKQGDRVVKTTPSGYSSTITIEYQLY